MKQSIQPDLLENEAAPRVKCVSRGGYGHMREGELGRLVEKIPSWFDISVPAGFTWPEYWVVETPDGRRVCGHADRFEEVKIG